MSKPSRATDPEDKYGRTRIFFVTTATAEGRALLQTERMANLFIEILRSYMKDGRFVIHDFVVMPNHVHLLMTVPRDRTLEQCMQLIKGSFSFRARKELGFQGEIWNRGFSDVQVRDERSFTGHRSYIEMNPVRAGFCNSPEGYPFGSVYLKRKKLAGAKAQIEESVSGTTEVVP